MFQCRPWPKRAAFAAQQEAGSVACVGSGFKRSNYDLLPGCLLAVGAAAACAAFPGESPRQQQLYS